MRSRNARQGGGRNAKPSRHGSGSCALVEIVMVGDAGRWWGGTYDVAMVLGVVRSCNARR